MGKSPGLRWYVLISLGLWFLTTRLLAHEMTVVTSGRDSEVILKYEQEAQKLSELAAQLGYALPKQHQLTFVPAGDLGQLSTLGRYALPHWYDGAQIFKGMGHVSGVLEFVVKGDPTSQSFYSDTTSFYEQISIIMHVLGHNDFSQNSAFHRATRNDTMPASLELYQYIRKLYEEGDPAEVSLYVQWLYTLLYLQDFTEASYAPPESFQTERASLERLKAFKLQALQGKKDQLKPLPDRLDTANVLAASIYHLSPKSPAWRLELMQKFERMARHYPGNVQTKIINEGWATFSQYLLTKHSHWQEHEEAFVELGGLLQGVAYPKVTNPYWLGLECWKNLYRRFRQEHAKSYEEERRLDQAFVAEAHDLMAWQSSYEFLRHGLDEQWVREQKFFLYRPASQEEISAYCGDRPECYPRPGEQANIVLSRNSERIINYIAREQADFSLVFPQIAVTSFDDPTFGGVALEHRVRHGFSLDLSQAVQALLVYALVMEKPVSLQTIYYPAAASGPNLTPQPIRIHMLPSGQWQLEGADDKVLSTLLEKAVASYLEDLKWSESEPLTRYRESKYGDKIKEALLNRVFRPVQGSSCHHNHGTFISHAPTTGQALLQYEAMLSQRFGRMLALALRGHIASQKTNSGVRFRVLPLIPQFQLDGSIQSRLLAAKPLAPVDQRSSLPRQAYQFGQDDSVKIERHKSLLPGDIFKVPQQAGAGQGEGEDGDDGDESSEKAGNGGQDPSEVEIPLADWGAALQEELGLPHLRRTESGSNELIQLKKKGTKRRDYGELVYRKMIPAALAYSQTEAILRGDALDFDHLVDKLVHGMGQLAPSDYVVRDRHEMPRAHNQAVMVIVMDFSGSMQGEPHKMAANLVYNLKALLLANYQDLKFRYVVYDTQAREFSEEDVFGKNPKFLGGGTSNVAGYEKAEEILKEYDQATWNKFLIGLGDAGAPDGSQTVAVLERIYPNVEYLAFVHTDNGYSADQDFLARLQDYSQRKKAVGYAALRDSQQASILNVLRTLFPPR